MHHVHETIASTEERIVRQWLNEESSIPVSQASDLTSIHNRKHSS